jgi:AmmeMemoRadiSam system protein B
VEPDGRAGVFVVWDLLRPGGRALHVSGRELKVLQLFDGRHTLDAIAAKHKVDPALSPDALRRLAARMDAALFLEGPKARACYDELAARPVRPPACLGSYEPEPAALRRQVGRLFTGVGGPGKPGRPRPDPEFRGALVPHVDYARGGRSYAWTLKEVFERTRASLFVIVGTSHYSHCRFTLTRKHFQTPLGVVPTDGPFIDRLVAHYGEGLFADELVAHLPEHSIELEVVLLQYLYPDRPFRIVPLVVGSFQDGVDSGRQPNQLGDVRRMIEALRACERDIAEPVCYLISGDLAHVGPKFGDPDPVHPAQLEHSRRQDEAILERAGRADPAGYFEVIAAEGDRRRICGLPPTYTVLEALRPSSGKLLHYDQWVHPHGFESVSFAGMAFYR